MTSSDAIPTSPPSSQTLDIPAPAIPKSPKLGVEQPIPGDPSGPVFISSPAVVIVQDKLWVVGEWVSGDPHENYAMYQTTVTLAGQLGGTDKPTGQLIDILAGDLLNGACTWKTEPMTVDKVPVSNVGFRCGLAAIGASLYFTWNDGNGLRIATRGASDPGPDWSSLPPLAAHDGTPLKPPTLSEHCLAAFGESNLMMGVSSTVDANGQLRGYVGSFAIEDINKQGATTWTAQSGAWLAEGIGISMDWCNIVGDAAPAVPTTDSPPPTRLWVSLVFPRNSKGIQGGIAYVLTIDTTGKLISTQATDTVVTSGANGIATPTNSIVGDGTMVRDLAGRLVRFQSMPAGHIGITAANTAAALPSDPQLTSQPLPVADQSTLTAPMASQSADRTRQPGVVFYPDTTRSFPTTDPSSGVMYNTANVYQIVLYSEGSTDGSSLLCQVSLAGVMQTFPSIKAGTPDQNDQSLIRIGSIVDGPLPVHNANLAKLDHSIISTVTYGATKTTGKTHEVSNSWTVGAKYSGHASKGAGPAWDLSMSGGNRSKDSMTDETSIITNKLKPTERADGKVRPAGSVWDTVTTFMWSAFRYFDAAGKPVVDGTGNASAPQAPLMSRIIPVITDGSEGSYMPYMVTPGDLRSYTPEAINDAMSKFPDYGDNYFHEVIEANAYSFADNTNYLTVSWEWGDANTTVQATSMHNGYNASTSTFDASAYAGVSGGFNILNIESMEVSAMVGGTYSHDVTTSTATTEGMSLSADPIYMTPDQQHPDPGMAVSFTCRVYFLPPPAKKPHQWLQELHNCLAKPTSDEYLDPADIDLTASAWKIVYVVDSYTIHDEKPYKYDGA